MSEFRFDPEPLVHKLLEHDVSFVLIGGVAATLHGSPVVTTDVDIAYERTSENLERLATVLEELHARLRGADDLEFVPDARLLKSGSNFTFVTDLGNLDCIGWSTGLDSYEQLSGRAKPMRLGAHTIPVASIDDLIAMKRAAGRPKDQIGIMHLEAIKEMRNGS